MNGDPQASPQLLRTEGGGEAGERGLTKLLDSQRQVRAKISEAHNGADRQVALRDSG